MTTAPASSADSRVGQTIAQRYRIVRLLGEGGMGAVYLAEHTLMKKRFALKMLHGEMAQNEEVIGRFRREAEAAAHLEHPHVVAATDFGQIEDGSFFLVLEFVDGTSLRAALAGGPMAPARALKITRQIALALERAHDAGIVHRDLKPENVMLVRKGDDDDFVKVLDFGVARFDAAAERETAAGQVLTRLGTVMGTPEYMSPEQALGERATARADLYTVGVMLFEMLAGARPFEGDDMTALMSMHMIAPVPAIAERAPGVVVQPEIEAIIRKLMEKDAAARYESARALIEAIDECARTLGMDVIVASIGAVSSDRMKALSPTAGPVSGAVQTPSNVAAPESFAKTAMAIPTPKDSLGPNASRPTLSTRAEPSGLDRAKNRATELAHRAREKLDPLIDRLAARTKLSRSIVAIGLGAAAMTLATTFFLVLILILRPSSSSSSSSGGGGGPLSNLPLIGVKTAPPEKVREATAKGAPALEALAEQYPQDPEVLHELAFAYDRMGRLGEAIDTCAKLVDASAALKKDVPRDVVRLVMRGATRFELADASFALLEEKLGDVGIEALLELAETKDKDVPEKTRARAASSLSKQSVRAKAPPSIILVRDLNEASTCEEKKDVLSRSGEKADSRAIETLKALKKTTGCGRGRRHDCFACLRKDDALDRAISAAEGRSPK
jgi:eukaryotic-like serine/threonine-protein kinase